MGQVHGGKNLATCAEFYWYRACLTPAERYQRAVLHQLMSQPRWPDLLPRRSRVYAQDECQLTCDQARATSKVKRVQYDLPWRCTAAWGLQLREIVLRDCFSVGSFVERRVRLSCATSGESEVRGGVRILL